MKTYILLYLFTIKKFKKNVSVENNYVNNINSELIVEKKKLSSGNNDIPENENTESEIHNFKINLNNYKLLKTLQNNNINSLIKISKINDYYKETNNNNNGIPNLTNGGLLNDWNFDINKKIF